MHTHSTTAEFPLKLANSLEKRKTLDIAYSTTYFCNHKVEFFLCAATLHLAFYLICDVRDYLHCLAKILATALLFNYLAVYATGCKGVPTCGFYIGEALIVSQVEVGLVAVDGNIALAVLLRVERTGRDIDIRVEFLNCDFVSSCLEQLSDRCRDDTFTQ